MYNFFQDISLFHSEARGTYINILAGTLGFAGAGATVAVTKLASNGVQIGKVIDYKGRSTLKQQQCDAKRQIAAL